MQIRSTVTFEDILNAVFEHIERCDANELNRNYADRLQCASDLIKKRLNEQRRAWDAMMARIDGVRVVNKDCADEEDRRSQTQSVNSWSQNPQAVASHS